MGNRGAPRLRRGAPNVWGCGGHFGAPTSNGFTLLEVLIALSMLAIVMTILYGTFSTSSATAELVEARTDDLSSLAGALDTLGREVRSSYEWLPGRQRKITFTTLTPIHEDGTPNV